MLCGGMPGMGGGGGGGVRLRGGGGGGSRKWGLGGGKGVGRGREKRGWVANQSWEGGGGGLRERGYWVEGGGGLRERGDWVEGGGGIGWKGGGGGCNKFKLAVADPEGGARPPFQKNNKKLGPIFYNGVVKNVICQYLYTI